METKMINVNEMIFNTLTGVGTQKTGNRKANVIAVLAALPQKIATGSQTVAQMKNEIRNIDLIGSELHVNISKGITTENDFNVLLQSVIDGHETKLIKQVTESGVKNDFLIVDLLKPRN